MRSDLRTIAFSRIVRNNVEEDPMLPPQAERKPFFAKHGSTEADTMPMKYYDHLWNIDDNFQVHCMLDEATRVSTRARSIKPFQNKKERRAEFQPMLLQHAGLDEWIAALQKCDDYLHARKCKSNSNFPLTGLTFNNYQSCVETTKCIEHVAF